MDKSSYDNTPSDLKDVLSPMSQTKSVRRKSKNRKNVKSSTNFEYIPSETKKRGLQTLDTPLDRNKGIKRRKTNSRHERHSDFHTTKQLRKTSKKRSSSNFKSNPG